MHFGLFHAFLCLILFHGWDFRVRINDPQQVIRRLIIVQADIIGGIRLEGERAAARTAAVIGIQELFMNRVCTGVCVQLISAFVDDPSGNRLSAQVGMLEADGIRGVFLRPGTERKPVVALRSAGSCVFDVALQELRGIHAQCGRKAFSRSRRCPLFLIGRSRVFIDCQGIRAFSFSVQLQIIGRVRRQLQRAAACPSAAAGYKKRVMDCVCTGFLFCVIAFFIINISRQVFSPARILQENPADRGRLASGMESDPLVPSGVYPGIFRAEGSQRRVVHVGARAQVIARFQGDPDFRIPGFPVKNAYGIVCLSFGFQVEVICCVRLQQVRCAGSRLAVR